MVAFNAFTVIDVFFPWDFLNRVKWIDKDWSVKIVGNKPTHWSICGIDLSMQGDLSDCGDADVVYLAEGQTPGWLLKIQAILSNSNSILRAS